ncbi:MAG: hypothetical protein AB7R40_24020 [Nitrospiraceae bacterium]
MTEIDLSPQLEQIREKYPEWWRSEEAQRQLQALWGDASCNAHGVLEAHEEIAIALEPQWKASVRIARAPNGWYAFAVSYSYALGGGTSPISVWNRTAYTAREEALEAGIRELKRQYQSIIDWQGYAPQSQKTNAARMIELLDSYLIGSRQMSLF